ncbi:MAG: MMPL family transporter, partial [Flavobacteriales bacterium]|nr:MMPL family transporter [Flavobacteriales bacterium]
PAVLLLVRTPVAATHREQTTAWYPLLHRLFRFVLRHRRRIPVAFAALAVACALIVPRMPVDNHLLGDWADHDPQKQDYRWLEETFGGVRPYEMEVAVLDSGSAWDHRHLAAMATVQDRLEQAYGVRAVLSPVTVVRALNKAFNGGDPAYFTLPDSPEETARLVRRAETFLGRDRMAMLVSADGRLARITGRVADDGGRRHLRRAEEIAAFARERTPAAIAFHPTGMAHMIDRSNVAMSRSMLRGLALAFLLVALTMALAFRNARMTVVALLPNMLPLLVVAACMTVAGMHLEVSTAMIFTIAFGIAVDDTIHMLAKLRIEMGKGRSLPYAMKRTMLSVGKALVVTTLLLLAGFAPLLASSLGTAQHMGLLVCITLMVASLTDLVLLPVLVLLGLPRR